MNKLSGEGNRGNRLGKGRGHWGGLFQSMRPGEKHDEAQPNVSGKRGEVWVVIEN